MLIPTPLCGWYANSLKVLAHCGNKGLGRVALIMFGTMQTWKQRLMWVPLLKHLSHVPQPRQPSLSQMSPQRRYMAHAPQMFKVVVVNNVDPQNPPQTAFVCGLQPIPLCLHQKPRFTTIDEMRNNERAKNLHLGLHWKVTIPPHMGELHKSAQPTHTTSINLLLQAGLGVNDASQIL